MEPVTTAALIGAGASLVGGLMGKLSGDKANKRNIKLQKQFAKQGIQWKVADAKQAGIHPLYALGAQTHSFTPSVAGDNSLGRGIADAGQDIGRAVAQGVPQEKRADIAEFALSYERAKLQNDLLAAQISQTNLETDAARLRFARELLGPKIPAPPSFTRKSDAEQYFSGSAPPGLPKGVIDRQPSKTTAHAPGQPGVEAAATPGFKWQNVGQGRWLLPTSEFAEILEGMGAAGQVAGPLAWWQANWDARGLGDDVVRYYDKARNWLFTPRRVYSGKPRKSGYTGSW